MANFLEEEESLNLSGLNLSGLDSLNLDGLGSYKKNDPLATSYDNFKIQFGGALQTIDELLGKDSFLSSWGNALEESGELGKEDYQPKYETSFLEAEGWDKVGWAIERAMENATGMGATVGAAVVAALAGPGTVTAGVAGTTFWGLLGMLNLDEVARTHIENSDKDIKDFDSGEKANLVFGTVLSTLLDRIAPNKIAKGVGGKNINVRDSLESLASKLDNFEKVKFANAVMVGLKKTAAIGLWEGGTEGAQRIVAEITSKTRGRDLTLDSFLGEVAAGTAGGTLWSGGAGYRTATQPTREAKQAQKILDAVNIGELQKAGEDYGIQVADYQKQFEDLVSSYEGPELQTKLKELTKPIDVEPKLYDFKRLETSTLSKLTKQAGDVLLNRSTDFMERVRPNLKTGKDYFHLNRALRSFADVQTGTGETQTNPSFNTLKHKNIGEYVEPFMDIRDKWARHYPLGGEIGSKVALDIDQYVGQSLEAKIDSSLKQELRSRLGAKKMAELEADIIQLKSIRSKMFSALQSRLGKDGLKIGFVKDYLTRGIDKDAVKADPAAFLLSLKDDVKIQHTAETIKKNATKEEALKAAEELAELQGNVPAGQVGHIYAAGKKVKQIVESAEQVRQRILNDVLNDVDPSTLTSEQIRKVRSRKGVDRPSFEKSRDGRWNRLDEQFRKKSPFESMGDYLMNASIRLGSAEAFGADNANRLNEDINGLLESGVISNEQAQRMWDLYDAAHHVYKRPQSDAGRTRQEAFKKIATVAAVKYLGMATISSITEPMWIGQRAGIINMLKAAPRVAGYMLSGLRRSIYGGREGREAKSSFARDLIRVMGFAINPAYNERVDKLFAGDNNQVLQLYFRTPAGLFLTQYTNFVRAWTAIAGLKMIEGQARKLKRLKGNARKRLEFELKENGMTIQDFEAMYRAGGNKIDVMNDAWLETMITKSDGTQTRVRDMIVPWLRNIVTDVALEPTAVNRPLWMSNPDLQLLAQLKSFPVLFGNTIAKRVTRKLNPKSCTPDLMGQMGTLAAIGAALGMGALALAIKDEIRGSERERGPIDIVSAIGVPILGEASITGYVGGPASSIADNFLQSVYGDGFVDTVGKTPEAILDILLRATVGTLGAELVDED